MNKHFQLIFAFLILGLVSCNNDSGNQKNQSETPKELTAKDILGNPEFQAISYGGYRTSTRDVQPTNEELKEDLKIMAAMGIRILRTYNTHLAQASNLLAAIEQLKQEDAEFEMYVMLGAWINCKNAWTSEPDHYDEDLKGNTSEIERAVAMAKQYPDIVKVIAVGNEAMVKWATSYHVQPGVILKWVNHLQNLKETGELPESLWITSSDNFASWGGGEEFYRVEDLESLVKAVDYVSVHTYPMHDTHYNPDFWGNTESEESLSDVEKIEKAMVRARDYAITQYQNTFDYIRSIDAVKPVHIGETGWASFSNGFYGPEGSKATDEYKEGLYHRMIRDWTNEKGISCFYFEAFDETWKDAQNPGGSENHFGLFTIDGKAKYPLWDLVDKGVFNGISRNGNPITKTYDGNKETLLKEVALPPVKAVSVAH